MYSKWGTSTPHEHEHDRKHKRQEYFLQESTAQRFFLPPQLTVAAWERWECTQRNGNPDSSYKHQWMSRPVAHGTPTWGWQGNRIKRNGKKSWPWLMISRGVAVRSCRYSIATAEHNDPSSSTSTTQLALAAPWAASISWDNVAVDKISGRD